MTRPGPAGVPAEHARDQVAENDTRGGLPSPSPVRLGSYPAVFGSWEDPPPPQNHRALMDWWAVAATLREHPGQWLKLPGQWAQNQATAIREGRVKALRPVGHYEAESRAIAGAPARRCTVYVRYVGQ